ncbi:L-serine ammonia-lyase, iron-sulfur-dependent, subunit alpha [Microbacterium sp. Marseille-Q6648]|uniref:L-serine ammonia-lyase, iron-sulfur-dependent, subunit alpha n=1 Tax=Microbacterium sp. Marseille-Q6648 TaxID=2937991 RepID=UPI00203D3FEF|nr:L-serine ammonia-lyase, iron-sulfur-dependent, subunit alpha [Microbacterium sp. Marseille-Q6648]
MSAYVSAFELFSIGVGPSSSHTVGPMRAARDFAVRLREGGLLSRVARVECTLFGSLGATGLGHGTPDAVVAGLQGLEPETVDPAAVRAAWSDWPAGADLMLAGEQAVPFAKDDIAFAPRTRLPGHPNALTLIARDADGVVVAEETYYSVGGGFIRRDGAAAQVASHRFPLTFASAEELLAECDERGITFAEAARLNEEALRTEAEVASGLDAIWDAMAACVNAGLRTGGELPGMLRVKRRASAIREQLEAAEASGHRELPGEWLGAFALAVNEENAAGGRVVTAPTNGAAGIVPAVAMYWWRFLADSGLGAGNAVTPYGELVGSALLGFGGAGRSPGGPAGGPGGAPGSLGEPGPAPGSLGEPGSAPGSLGEPGSAPGSLGEPGSAPGSLGEPGSAPGSLGEPGSAPGSLGEPGSSPRSLSERGSAPGSLGERGSSPRSLSERGSSPRSLGERGSSPPSLSEPGGRDEAPESISDEAVAEANRRRGIRRFLLTATALGSLFKANASISGAEGGCQAEVGSACAMAAGGLTAVMGGTNRQIENAAEIAMEHHLGLTCDPVGGLVQIPCIERNAIAASTAVTAARLALRGDGSHYVSLDAVVETMRQTGIDMSTKYKETSEGGLAVNVIEC